ncbi:calmodulin binding protein PICBP [Ricinus communis]|uniref:calmodulin binding protein PICBP n=1 Tax=Ricinus communis TaxID=3988 RepID=UPI00201B27F4|nr:calmodulin binding protein PICBP [Ricinus communis]
MVQRKVPSELGIQADHVKSEKRLGNLKPSSCQHQDGKNRGPDMKKKMKRSRSIKLSDIESLKSSPLRNTVSEHGKPPPLSTPAATTTPQKQPMIKTSGGSPNYMKATSSSEARKERSHISSLNTPTSSDSKNLRTRNSSNSKLSSASSDKPTRSLTRTSSLKLVRTLTKTPSFKPARSATKKCSRVALCADMDVQTATCSSTLKDSKFPAYLMLNPGGTEAEGTSVLKVCPYTYCSLNGHHHAPLPPLKCFLKAKRRSVKAQRSVKLEVPSPCKVEPSVDGTEEISSELLIFSTEKHLQHEETGMDFYIEIYAKTAADGAEATEKHTEDDEGTRDFAGEHKKEENKSSIYGGIEVAHEQDNRKQGAEKVADASSYLEISYASTEEDDNISEASDMDWEEGQFLTSEIHTEADYSHKPEKEYCINVEYLSKIKQLDLPDGLQNIASDDMISNCTEEILVDEVLQELFEEETASFDTQSRDCDSEMEDMLQELSEKEKSQTDGDSTRDQPSSIEDAFEDPTTVEENREEAEGDLTGDANASTSMGEPTTESAVANIESSNIIQISDASLGSSEVDQDDVEVNDKQNHIIGEAFLSDNLAGDTNSIQELVTEIEPAKHCDHLLDSHHESINIDENQKLSEEDQDVVNKFRIPTSTDSEEQYNSRISKISTAENDTGEVEKMEGEACTEPDTAETVLAANNEMRSRLGSRYLREGRNSSEELASICNRKWTIQCKKPTINSEEERNFNPREPNFLPVVPDPEAEKVNLKHQNMDDKKNSEEWMLDYALQQAVTKLAPARKRKVALLVEAFEAVLPVPKYETHFRNTSAAFTHTRPMQACS